VAYRLYWLSCWRIANNVRNRALTELLVMEAATGGDGYIFPATFYIFNKLLGVVDHRRHQYHICKNECCRFEQTPEKEWKAAAESGKAVCHTCGAPQFHLVRRGRKHVWQPHKVGAPMYAVKLKRVSQHQHVFQYVQRMWVQNHLETYLLSNASFQ
jgi:hypothetical protein